MPQVGDRLGDFALVREVGRGNMGVVYEARQESLGRRVAVKVLTPAAAGDPLWTDRFRTEALAAARLSHPGIAAVYAVGEAAGVPWFAMEFVEGKDVSQVLDGRPHPSPREAARIVRDAALALDHAHVHGVVHRDVKPGNLMLREDGRVVLTDFGLAKEIGSGSLTATGSIVGTPFYMSPEQASGVKDAVGPKTDVYGLGATLYEMLAGRPPFVAENAVALLRMIADKDAVPPSRAQPGVPRDLETIALACLERSPERRYASCRALADDLERYLRDEPISRRRPGPIERARRLVARNRVASAAVAGAFVLVAVGWWLAGRAARVHEDERLRLVDGQIEEARAALARGDTENAEALLARLAADEIPSAEQRKRIEGGLKETFEHTVASATEREDPEAIDEGLSRLERRGLTAKQLDAVAPRAWLSVRTDPPEATVVLRRLGAATGEVARWRTSDTVAERPVSIGFYRLSVSAPDRVSITTTLALGARDDRVELEVRLPRSSDVPPDMVVVGGEIVRVATRGKGVADYEVPPFLLDVTEATTGAYARFLGSLPAGAPRDALTPAAWSGGRPPPGPDALPATGVTSTMAEEFLAQAGKRLPTEAELELATLGLALPRRRGRQTFDFTRWPGRPNVLEGEAKAPLPVDRSDALVAPCGARDLLGNVAEWTASSPAGAPWRVAVFGGSYEDTLGASTTSRYPYEVSPTVGFRGARSLPPLRRPREAAPPAALARRLRVEADGTVVETRRVEVRNDSALPAAICDVPLLVDHACVSYRVLAGRAAGKAVSVGPLATSGTAAKTARTAALTFSPPLAPGEAASVEVDEARCPLGDDDRFVRQGSRFDLDVAADAGLDVELPAGSLVERTGLAEASVERRGDRPVVVVAPAPGSRLRLEALVPGAKRDPAAVARAVADSGAALSALARLDAAGFAAALAPEYHSDAFDDAAHAVGTLSAWRERYESADLKALLWGAEVEGDRVVVRRVVQQLELLPKAGGPADSPITFPRILATYGRIDPLTGRFLETTEDVLSLAPRGGRVRADGAWVAEEFGVVVKLPKSATVKAGPRGISDLDVFVSDSTTAGLTAEVFAFLRVQAGAGIPPLSKEDFERYGFRLVSGPTPLGGDGGPVETVATSGMEGAWRADRRLTWRRGEQAVVAQVFAVSAVSADDARTTLVRRRADVDRFLASVTVESESSKKP